MASEEGTGHAAPHWFVAPGDGDSYAVISLVVLLLALYGVVTLYAAFDRWADKQAHGTPLARTIPTLLAIALLYEIFPLGHFYIFLPITAILIALMSDWSRFHAGTEHGSEHEPAVVMPTNSAKTASSSEPDAVDGSKEIKDV